jgi:hypothetical protein
VQQSHNNCYMLAAAAAIIVHPTEAVKFTPGQLAEIRAAGRPYVDI